MRLLPAFALSAAATLAAAAPVAAQERSFNFALRGGVGAGPAYPGSDETKPLPDLGFTFGSLNWGRTSLGADIGNIPDNGLAFRGALKVIGSRDVADNPELAGLEDIDTAVELGVGVIYRQTNWQAFGEVRQGFGGHDGVTGTLGADLVLRPTDRWTLTAGPRVNLGNSTYAGTYFGVSAAEAATSGFGAFDPDGGVLGAGVELGATYRIDDRWAIEGLLTYTKLQNEAADSPITQAGSEDQWAVRVGVSRAFTLRF